MQWIKEVETAKSIDDLMTSQSSTGRRDFPDYDMLDATIASALKRLLDKHVHFRKRVSVEEQRAQKYDRFSRARLVERTVNCLLDADALTRSHAQSQPDDVTLEVEHVKNEVAEVRKLVEICVRDVNAREREPRGRRITRCQLHGRRWGPHDRHWRMGAGCKRRCSGPGEGSSPKGLGTVRLEGGKGQREGEQSGATSETSSGADGRAGCSVGEEGLRDVRPPVRFARRAS